jgi:acetyl-CoA carboxylase carboxyl transferase subunit alpha
MIGGLGKIGGQSFMIVGQQKDIHTRLVNRNFGMANQKDIKALRLMKMAESLVFLF